MPSPFRNIISILLLCFYVAGGALIEVTHHDVAAFSSPTEARLSHHDCGGAKAHVTPDAGNCLACTYAKYRVAIQGQGYRSLRTARVLYGSIINSIGKTPEADVLYSGKRGPPFFSV